jgi:hypothetical protein
MMAHDPTRRANSNNLALQYAFWPDLKRKDLVMCMLCIQKVHAGVGRLVRHLTRGSSDVKKCPESTAAIQKTCVATY